MSRWAGSDASSTGQAAVAAPTCYYFPDGLSSAVEDCRGHRGLAAGLGRERYEPAFRDDEIDWEMLPELTEGDLEKPGPLLGPGKKLLQAIAGWSAKPSAVSVEAGPSPRPVSPEAERRQLTVMLAGSTAPAGMNKRGHAPMSTQEIPPPFALFRMITGYYVSQAIYVIARLGVADLLADGPRDVEELARQSKTHAPSLQRVLRLLVTTGLFTEDDEGRFALTPTGGCLRAGVPGSMRAVALLFGGITQRAWGDLRHSVETGEPAFGRVFGMDSFAYLAEHPDEAANFDAAMAGFSTQIANAVAAAYDFSGCRRVADVGGGNGTLLVGILRAHPTLKGTLFDLPHVVERALPQLRELGLADRCDVMGGDFFVEVAAGADAYLLKHVIHDWDDERAVAILESCRRAMGATAKLVIVEGIYPPRIDQSDESRGAAANDVNMLVCTGGRQRSEAEFRRLFAAAGFALAHIIPTGIAAASVIEGVPA